MLLQMMVKVGYGSRKEQKKSMKDVFIQAVEQAEKEFGIKRSAKAWQKKFGRMKTEYSNFITKLQQSGRDGDDPDLYDKPDFYDKMHELESGNARHDPPSLLSSDGNSTASGTSSRKKAKLSHREMLSNLIESQKDRHDDLLDAIKQSNEERAKTRSILEKIVEKL